MTNGEPTEAVLPAAAVLEALPAAVVVTDTDGSVIYANPAAHQVYGYETGTLVGRNVADTLVTAAEQVEAADIMDQLRRREGWSGVFPVRRSDGTVVLMQLADTPVWADGQMVGIVGLAQPVAGAEGASLSVTRLAELAEAIARVAGAEDTARLGQALSVIAADVLGAHVATLYVLEPGDRLRLVAAGGELPERERWESVAVSNDTAAGEAIMTGRPVSISGVDALRQRYGALVPSTPSARAVVALPLLVGDRRVGAIVLAFPFEREFTALDMQFLGALADSFGQAIDRFNATQAAVEAGDRLHFLAEASSTLAHSLDYNLTLERVARLAVPRFADWCGIDLLEDGQLRQVAIAHVDPAKVELARRLREVYPPAMDSATGAPAVVRTGVTELYSEISEAVLTDLDLDDERVRLVRDLQLNSAVNVALTARGRTFGVLTLVYAESGRHYGPGDLAFVEELARRAAVAIDNAQLHSETLRASLQLQEAILPESFPDSGSWRVAVHYRPAGRTEVGGDFYDAFTLPDGRMIALVGDVMGRGVSAAASMAQVRSAARAYLALDPDPLTVLDRLDTMFERLDPGQFVTMAYAVLDLDAGRAELASAGHLPPLLIRADGEVEMPAVPSSPPLGVARRRRQVLTVPFQHSDVLLLFTDGLVERRGEDLDHGLARLASHSSRLAHELSDEALADVADTLRDQGHDDDVTLLAVRSVQTAPQGRGR